MHIEVKGLKSKTIVLAQRNITNDVVTLMVAVKAESSEIDFIVETMSDKISKIFSDLSEAIQFYEQL